MPKKLMKQKIYHERNAEIQRKTYISAEVFFLLTCDQVFCLVSVFASVRGGLDPIIIQSNHLLGKTTRHTHGMLACQFNGPLASVWLVKMAFESVF